MKKLIYATDTKHCTVYILTSHTHIHIFYNIYTYFTNTCTNWFISCWADTIWMLWQEMIPSAQKCFAISSAYLPWALSSVKINSGTLYALQKCKTHCLYIIYRGSLPTMGAARERPDFDIRLPLGVPLIFFPWGYHLRSFPQGNILSKQQRLGIRVFPLLGELPKAIEPHLPVCQLYLWQLSPAKWSSPTTKSIDP